MKCPKCRSDNRNEAKFCHECGHRFELVCPGCGAANPLGSKFCDECGQSFSPKEETPAIDFSRPKSYTPKYLADKILTTRNSVEGERKLVTVLSADVVHSTGMSENLDPEEVHSIMDGCFKILMKEIHRHEGTINQFLGDGIMAIFGAPITHEDHAQRACYAVPAIIKPIVDRYPNKATEGFGQVKIENGQKEEGEEFLNKARKTYLELGIESN